MPEIHQQPRYTICFVNSEEKPIRTRRFDVYQRSKDPSMFGKYTFSQLVELTYERIIDDEIKIHDTLLDWEVIKIKSHCMDAAKVIIDSQKGIGEFISE